MDVVHIFWTILTLNTVVVFEQNERCLGNATVEETELIGVCFSSCL